MRLNTFFDKVISEVNFHSNIPKDFLYNKLNVIKGSIDTVFKNENSDVKISKIINQFRDYTINFSSNKEAINAVFNYRIFGMLDPMIGLYPNGITKKAMSIWDVVVKNKTVKKKMDSYADNTKAKWAVAIVYFKEECYKLKIKSFKL
jgi:hypothetical protein